MQLQSHTATSLYETEAFRQQLEASATVRIICPVSSAQAICFELHAWQLELYISATMSTMSKVDLPADSMCTTGTNRECLQTGFFFGTSIGSASCQQSSLCAIQ